MKVRWGEPARLACPDMPPMPRSDYNQAEAEEAWAEAGWRCTRLRRHTGNSRFGEVNFGEVELAARVATHHLTTSVSLPARSRQNHPRASARLTNS